MFGRRDQLEQIDDVDEAQLQVRQPFAEDRGGRKRLLCGHVTTARQDGIGLFPASVLARAQMPNPYRNG